MVEEVDGCSALPFSALHLLGGRRGREDFEKDPFPQRVGIWGDMNGCGREFWSLSSMAGGGFGRWPVAAGKGLLR